LRINILIMSNR